MAQIDNAQAGVSVQQQAMHIAADGAPCGEITNRGFIIPYVELKAFIGGEVKMKKLLNSMTVKEKVHPGRARNIAGAKLNAYKISGGSLIVPRRMAGALHRIVSHRFTPYPLPRRISKSNMSTDAELYPYQKAATDHILSVLDNKTSFGVAYLQMDTGLGKTRVGCAIIVGRAEPAAIIVPTEAIAQQWVEEFAEIYPAMRVAIYHNLPKNSSKVQINPDTHDVIIIIINTFRAKEPEFMAGFGTTILDEVHELHSKCNSNALWLAQTRAVVGLSATPGGCPGAPGNVASDGRPDGLDRFIFHFLGEPIYPKDIPNFDVSSVNFKCNVRAIEYSGHPDYCDTITTPAGTMSAIMTITNILNDPYRMNLIIAEIDRLCNMINISTIDPVGKRHGVFVFAETREFLPKLKAALLNGFARNAVILIPELDVADIATAPENGAIALADVTPDAANDEISVLRGGAAKNAVSDAKRAGAHIVLTTYGFSRRGISLPDMTCIIAATPRRNGLNQIIGRILRRGSDETITREFIDIIDINTGLRGQFADRRKIYVGRRYPINKFRTLWSEYGGVTSPVTRNTTPNDCSLIFERDVTPQITTSYSPPDDMYVGDADNETYLTPDEIMDLLESM